MDWERLFGEDSDGAGHPARLFPLDAASYAVVDLETTGFWGTDRVVEVAVVCLDSRGQVEREYASLVNPSRDMGATPEIHGVTPAMAGTAPPFREVADDLLQMLPGRVLVAHNASFDHRFLGQEFTRLGIDLPGQAVLCTRLLASDLLDLANPSLPRLCDCLDVLIEGHHSALGDARACARAFGCLLERARDAGARTLADLGLARGPVPASSWPSLAYQRTVWTRVDAAAAAAALPPLEKPALGREELLGCRVCLTGEFQALDRGTIELHLQGLGMTVQRGVSRKTDLLVAADPHSLSGKARRARELGVPIMDEETFWAILGHPGLPLTRPGEA